MIYKPIKWEEKVRWCFETIFQEHFKKCRPLWLKGLELDGYCEKLQIAFEFQGPHHYEDFDYKRGKNLPSSIFQERDKIKVKICAEMNVKLFVIPYTLIDSVEKVVREIERISKEFNLHHSLFHINPKIHYTKLFRIRKNLFLKEPDVKPIIIKPVVIKQKPVPKKKIKVKKKPYVFIYDTRIGDNYIKERRKYERER